MSISDQPNLLSIGTGKIKVAGLQIATKVMEKEYNLQKVLEMIPKAAQKGTQIIVTPETSLTGFTNTPKEKDMAEAVPGPAADKVAKLAKKYGTYILFGTTELKDEQFYNSVVAFDRRGQIMGIMRKVHLNKYEAPMGWRNGSEFPVWKFETATGICTGGVEICYDREVPESSRILALKNADIIFNPQCCSQPAIPPDNIHRALQRTRAYENEVYIFMVNHAAPRENGHSMLFDYNGDIIFEADETEQVFIYELDIDKLNKHRKTGYYGKHHRRPETYGTICDPRWQIHTKDANLPPGHGNR